jgi:membrane protease YdiL (CAAX protease family)
MYCRRINIFITIAHFLMIMKIKNNHWSRALLIIIPFIVIVGLFQVIALSLLDIPISSTSVSEKTPTQKLVVHLFSFLGTIITIFIFRKYVDKKTIISLGFRYKGKKHTVLGLLIGLMAITTGFLLLMANKQLSLSAIQLSFPNIITYFSIYIFVAFNEEVLIRGYMLNNLMSSINKWAALIISSLIFSIMHLANPNINLLGSVNLFLAGIILGLPYLYSRNLWFSFAFHFSWNFFQGTIFGFNVSGINGYSLIVQNNNSDNLWNGGKFGFEGSITATILQIICIIILFFIYKPSNSKNSKFHLELVESPPPFKSQNV